MTGWKSFATAAMAVLALGNGAARAVDGVSIEAGRGNGADMVRIGIQRDWKARWMQTQDWHVGGYWELALGQWHRASPPGFNEDITEIGLTPVFRLQRNDLRGVYLEAAIGFHLLSRTSLDNRRFSTTFQFGDHIGAGLRLGARGEFDIGYRFQHLSNADIKTPNDGMDFHQLRLQYRY